MAGLEGNGDQLREKCWLGPVIHPGGADDSAPKRRARDLGWNPDENVLLN